MLTDYVSWALGESPKITVSGVHVVGKCSALFTQEDLDEMSQEERARLLKAERDRNAHIRRKHMEALRADPVKYDAFKRRKALESVKRRERKRTNTDELASAWREPMRAFLGMQGRAILIEDVLLAVGVEHDPTAKNAIEPRAAGKLLREFGWRPSRVKVNGENTWAWVRS